MADLLLELFSEEIPARMQARAEADLGSALTGALEKAGLSFAGVQTFSGPRRLAVHVEGLSARSADVSEERKGPKVGAPDKAVEGFLRGAGLTSIDQAEIQSDPKKGEFYVARIETPGRSAADIIAEAVPAIIRSFSWPKSMRWGSGDLRWVRPLHRILCVLDGAVVPFSVEGIESANQTEGHRVHGRGPFTVTGLADYHGQLEGPGHVRLARADRKQAIAAQARKVCEAAGLELVEDEGLLEEVTGLAEWPSVILGQMDPDFLDLPPEVVRLSMRTHQKYFAVRNPKTGDLAPNFVVVANLDATDGGTRIAAGNARVLSARLSDARFFWENDKKTGLAAMAAKLGRIQFKKELGSMADKAERVAALARDIAPLVDADPEQAERAGRLCKADLVSEMVYEFPELQGVMGRYYAQAAGEPAPVASAIGAHYSPVGPTDTVPTEPVAIAVALADKLDTLVGFWAIDEKPTGSKDPFALRRAALGVVRIILENGLRLPLLTILLPAMTSVFDEVHSTSWNFPVEKGKLTGPGTAPELEIEIVTDLFLFTIDRLKQVLKDEGERPDLIDAAHGASGEYQEDMVQITQRMRALSAFLKTPDGENLVAGYKRAVNILKAEEKKDGASYDGEPDRALLQDEAEIALHAALTSTQTSVREALGSDDYTAAMTALAALRAPIDTFFDDVTVNAPDVAVRRNRLYLLSQIRSVLGSVANFSLIEHQNI